MIAYEVTSVYVIIRTAAFTNTSATLDIFLGGEGKSVERGIGELSFLEAMHKVIRNIFDTVAKFKFYEVENIGSLR